MKTQMKTENEDKMAFYTRPANYKIVNENNDKSYAEYMNERSFRIEMEPAIELVSLFNKHGWARRGKSTWSLHAVPENNDKFLGFISEYAEEFSPSSLACSDTASGNIFVWNSGYSHQLARSAQPFILNTSGSFAYGSQLNQNVAGFFPAGSRRLGDVDGYRELLASPSREFFNQSNRGLAYGRRDLDSGINVDMSTIILEGSLSNNTFYLTLKSGTGISSNEGRFVNLENYVSGRFVATKRPSENKLYHYQVMEFVNTFGKIMPGMINAGDYTTDMEKGKDSYFMSTVSGQPTQVALFRGSEELPELKRPKKRGNGAWGKISFDDDNIVQISLAELDKVKKVNKNADFVAHPSFLDIQNMLDAKPYEGEERLYNYQRKAVGLQLSTEVGFLNSLDTGIGKSIVQLTAMRERAKTIENYRGIIVCQSNTRKQWVEYMTDKDSAWFPEAQTFILDSSKKLNGLLEVLGKEGPVVVVATFNMASLVQDFVEASEEFNESLKELTIEKDSDGIKELITQFQSRDLTVGEVLHDMKWNDICADEATSIRGASSKQSKALWVMRKNSERGTALTATPFNKSIDDIARLLEWVRNSKTMFYGNQLSNLYSQEDITEESALEIFNSLFPMVFRFTKEEAEREEQNIQIPTELTPETILLEPTAEEKALSHACEYELKRIVQELETALDNFDAKTPEEKEELAQAREELRAAHGQWMAGTNLARLATSNPASIMKSESVAAQLLIGQGLVNAAMGQVPTKQRILMERTPKHIAKGQQILVFTDFVDVAESLKTAYEQIGVRAGVFGSKNLKKRDENRIAFQNGELDVLICTKAAERGLTLHKASVTYHYDISWTLEPLLQKAGRAARVGSQNKEVETYFLILKDTIEEKVVEKVFTQGTLSSMVLDHSRGVDISNTTTGKLMGGLTKASQNIQSRRGALEFGKALLGV